MMHWARVVVCWTFIIFFTAIFVCLITSISSAELGDHTGDERIVELISPVENNGSDPIPRYNSWPELTWRIDPNSSWWGTPETISYTLYISTNESQIQNMNPQARSPRFQNQTDNSTVVSVEDLTPDLINITYWGISAKNETGNTTYSWGGAYRYDYEPPSSATNFTVGPTAVFHPVTGHQLIRPDENYTLTVKAPSILEDPGMSGVEFQVCEKRYWDVAESKEKCSRWSTIGYDNDTSDRNYTINWTAEKLSWSGPYFFRILAYDDLGYFSQSLFTNVTGVESFCDVYLKNVSLSNYSLLPGENVTIFIVLHNDNILNCEPSDFDVLLMYDDDGIRQTLDTLQVESIDPDIDYYPDDPLLGPGDRLVQFTLEAPVPRGYGEIMNFTIIVEIFHMDSSNGQKNVTFQVFNAPMCPYGFRLSTSNKDDWDDSHQTYIANFGGYIVYDSVQYKMYGPGGSKHHPNGWPVDTDWFNAPFFERAYWDNEDHSAWLVELNISSMPDGEYLMIFQVYKDSQIVYEEFEFIQIDRSTNADEDDDHDRTSMWILLISLSALIILMVFISNQKDAPSLANSSTTCSQGAGTMDEGNQQSDQNESFMDPNVGEGCVHCGGALGVRNGDMAIRMICPECGKENIRQEFRKK